MGQVKHCTSGHCHAERPRFVALCEDCEGEVRYENGVPVHLDWGPDRPAAEQNHVLAWGRVVGRVVYRSDR